MSSFKVIRDTGQPISEIATGRFTKRTYSLRELSTDISFLIMNMRDVRRIMREKLIASAFRERLML